MDPTVASFKLSGLVAAPFTHFAPDGSVDRDVIPLHAAELVAQGVKAVFVNGTTGEGYSLTAAERALTVEAWVAAARTTGLNVISMITAESIAESVSNAAHAVRAGANAISWQPSTFFKPEGVPGIIEALTLVASAAPSLPLYYYHIPKTAVAISCVELLEAVAAAQATGALRSFRGIKYSNPDLYVLSSCMAVGNGTFDMAYGFDEQLLGAVAMGVKGAVGSTYNYCGKVANAIIDAVNKGDLPLARRLQRGPQRVVDLLHTPKRYGPAGCNVNKAIMELRLRARAGLRDAGKLATARAAGVRTVFAMGSRVPVPAVTPEGLLLLEADLDAIGFFGPEWM